MFLMRRNFNCLATHHHFNIVSNSKSTSIIPLIHKYSNKFISSSTTTSNDKAKITTPKVCVGAKPKVVELGQPTVWTHSHLFDPAPGNLPNQVTPGLTKREFEDRRINYVRHLTSYQNSYMNAKKLSLQNTSNFIAIIPSGSTTYLAPDVPHMFKQNGDFLYLTGFKEPNSVLVISRTSYDHSSDDDLTLFKSALFVKERNERTELWEGPCSGPENTPKLTGIEKAYSSSELKSYLQSLLKETTKSSSMVPLWRYPTQDVQKESGPNCNNQLVEDTLDEFISDNETRLVDMSQQDSVNGSIAASYFNSSRYFAQLCRVHKSKAEIDIMRKACEISGEAFVNAMQVSHPLVNEHLLHARFDFDCKVRGAERLAYIPVIAGGNRATTLHYIRNNQIVDTKDLLLLDGGCEYRDYAADITRTWPVSGRFSDAQKDLYEACLNTQLKCIEHCVPGITLQQLYYIMMNKLGDELNKLDLIDKEMYSRVEKQQNKGQPGDRLPMDYMRALSQFCPHDVGHYLGLDVHDSPEVAKTLALKEGSVITVEPGIYINANNKSVPNKYRGIGIRIEDDVVITSTGCEVLSRSTPKTIQQIETLLSC